MDFGTAREKSRTWKQFIQAHWDSLCGCDFFTVEDSA
jgi:hypothetical protein